MILLRVIYNYGSRGREEFYRLKESTAGEYQPYFSHIECDLIDSSRYA